MLKCNTVVYTKYYIDMFISSFKLVVLLSFCYNSVLYNLKTLGTAYP
jgi:hypothetical protein